jgi:hypothetical protein
VTAAEQLAVYVAMLRAGAPSGALLEVRYSTPRGGMRQWFTTGEQTGRLLELVPLLARFQDVYTGVALRDEPHGGAAAVSGSHLLFADCDDERALAQLARFALPATLQVASGTPRHQQTYWQLAERISPGEVTDATARLAATLCADPASTDLARIARPPGTLNHKRTPALPVSVIDHRPDAIYQLAELLAHLPPAPHAPAGPAARSRAAAGLARVPRNPVERELRAISAEDYVRVLTGREPNRAGKLICPFHPDTRPSLQLYPDGTFYCYGRSCHRGGGIFDFAAALWQMPTSRDAFAELRDRLAERFHLDRPMSR